jgi:hypothetical protein
MRSPLRALLITGSLVAASLGGAASAAAKSSPPPPPPTLITTNFACSNGVCEVGPGNVGMSFAAGLDGTGGPAYTGPECNPYTMKVISGSLPPGLQLGEPDCEWTVTGTATQAGTYPFTVQITPAPNNLGQIPGPSGTQQLTITIGTGNSDRAVMKGAEFNVHVGGLTISAWDANIGARWSVSVTSTGRVLFSNAPRIPYYPIDGSQVVRGGSGYPCPFGGCDLTVTNNLGSSATVFLGKPTY